MRFPQIIAVVAGLSVASVAAAAPTSQEMLAGMLKAAGGNTAMAAVGVIKFDVSESESLSDGTTNQSVFTAWADTPGMRNLRLQLGTNVVLAVNNDSQWATIDGQVDTRPQSARRVRSAINSKVFPLLLPFSLQMPGISFGDVAESRVEGVDTWRMAVNFPPNFFGVPTMDTPWFVHADRKTLAFVAIETVPPVGLRKVADEGMRYRPLKWTTIGGVRLASEVIIDGVDFSFNPNGHVRVTHVTPTLIGRFDPRLFVHPDRLEAFDSGDVPTGDPER